MSIRVWFAFAVLFNPFVGCEPVAPARDEATPASQTGARDSAKTSRLIVPADAAIPLRDPPQLLTREQLAEGWIALFDGRTLFGWVANSGTDWSVNEGEIVSAGSEPGLLVTTSRWRDYELKCEVRLAKGGNSGVFLRTTAHPKNPADDCLEFNFCDSHETFPTGSLVGRAKAETPVLVEGDWHAVRLVVDGERVTAEIDGKPILDAASPDFAKTGGGYIGLQQNGGEVRFRNVFLKPLATTPLEFAGDLTRTDFGRFSAWRPVPGSKAEFKIGTGDELTIRGGPGFVETKQTFDDFVLQFETKLNAKDVNSGLFFRAEKGTEQAPSNGYEMQLQNTIADGDRTKPADYGDGFGTGAIFRRQRARYVNASDEEWFAMTLVADGNRFASWVNGLQVTDFPDDRKPDPNPRKGRRDEAGHLSLQGHDPATDASFRNVRIKARTFE